MPGLPTRLELDEAPKEYLTQGAPFKADVTVVDVGEGPMVVKDFARRSWWRRLIGRLEVDRETRAYTYLGPMPWFPAFIGRIDSAALAVEKVEGITLRFAEDIDRKARRLPRAAAHRNEPLDRTRFSASRCASLPECPPTPRRPGRIHRPRGLVLDTAGPPRSPPFSPFHRSVLRGQHHQMGNDARPGWRSAQGPGEAAPVCPRNCRFVEGVEEVAISLKSVAFSQPSPFPSPFPCPTIVPHGSRTSSHLRTEYSSPLFGRSKKIGNGYGYGNEGQLNLTQPSSTRWLPSRMPPRSPGDR